MFLSLDQKAVSWFSEEFGHSTPIRLYPQYSGFGNQYKGYSIAFSAEVPVNAGFMQEMDGITFYAEESDRWFFGDIKTILRFDDAIHEIVVNYEDAVQTAN